MKDWLLCLISIGAAIMAGEAAYIYRLKQENTIYRQALEKSIADMKGFNKRLERILTDKEQTWLNDL